MPPADVLDDDARIAHARNLGLVASAEALDLLTEMAATRVGAADVRVSLTAGHRYMASLAGMDLPTLPGLAGRLTPLLTGPGAVVSVPDARADPRLADYRPVRDGAVRACLGVPLVTKEGDLLGALCAIDDRPHRWTRDDGESLAKVAAAVVKELELARETSELLASQARLDRGFTAARAGSFDWDIDSGLFMVDRGLMELLGYGPDTYEPRIESLLDRVHPDDRDRVRGWVDTVTASPGEFTSEFRVRRPDGTERWLVSRGRTLPGRDGRPRRLLGAGFDTTDERDEGASIRRLLDIMKGGFLLVDNGWHVNYINAEAERVLGGTRRQLLGRDMREAFPQVWGHRRAAAYRRAMVERVPMAFEAYYPPVDAWFEVRIWPGPDGLAIYFLDISDRRRAEDEREKANERLRSVAGASDRMSRSLEPDTVLSTLVDEVIPRRGTFGLVAVTGEVEAALTGNTWPYPHEHTLYIRAARHRTATVSGVIEDRLVGTGPFHLGDARGVGHVARTGHREWLADVGADEIAGLIGGGPLPEETLQALRPRSVLTVPLRARGATLGALLVVAPVSGELDRRLIQEVAARGAAYLDNALIHAGSRQVGLTLQRSLLPRRLPEPDGVALAARYQPGEAGVEVGGDFYLAHELADRRLVLAIGDVVGRGIHAAATMGQLRAVVYALAHGGDAPDEVLHRLSSMVVDVLSLEFATLLLGTYDPADRRLVVSSAGHPPPLLAPVGGEPAFIPVRPGAPLGAPPGHRSTYESLTIDVPRGATLLLYTDGLIERRGQTLETGMEQLRRALVDASLPPDDLCDHVLKRTGREGGVDDDVALLVLSHPEPRPLLRPDPDRSAS